MLRPTLILFAVLMLASGTPAADLIIDDFSYASDAEAQASWHPSSLNPEVSMAEGSPWGERVMLMPCPFTQDISRAYWDRDVALDLTAHQAIALEIFAPDPGAISYFTLYFHVSDGWYYRNFSFQESGWNSIRLALGDFATSSATVPLEQVDRIRLSPWKAADRDTSLAISELRAFTPEILLTEGFYLDNASELLTELGLEHGTITEAQILDGGLSDARLLLVGHHAYLSDAAMDEVDAWVAGGGRVIAFFTLPPRVASLLGLHHLGSSGQDMRAMHFDAPDVVGLPDVVEQATWNIFLAEPDRPDARVIATWEADDGTMLSDPAWLLSDTGAWMSHVLLKDGGEAKCRMLLAIVGHFLPEAWADASLRAIDRIGHVGPHTEYTAAVASIEADAARTPRLAVTQAWLVSAEALRLSALTARASGEHAVAVEAAGDARESLRQAYYRSQAVRFPEIRACWESQGTGPYPGDWPRTAGVLADNGFNAVAPIMFTGGMAHYPSAFLPPSDTHAQWGDQVAQCVAACHARGVEVHARKITWNLLWTSQSFIDSMRAAGRTQMDVSGADVDWLCPSDPLNQALELDVMLEVARGYGVDGINLDFIRYPDRDCCYCPQCRARFEAQMGQPVANWPGDCHGTGVSAEAYRDWRVEQITSLMRALRGAIDAEGLDVEISADVFSGYPACRESVGQDWVAWIDEGLLDFVCPMDYTESASQFEGMVQTQSDFVAGRTPLVPGIGVTSSNATLTPDQAILQARITRDLGAQGFILFSLYAPLAEGTLPPFGLGFTAPLGPGLEMR
ncbi:family 10 glycosylhydrolase [Candidatus Sumerlaeota bacterium]|nr:family 10 glycosylhydrolase [Candidatus Sumerlaeota bacterium]